MNTIKTALISLSNKEGIVPFAHFLTQNHVHILSTGGTASVLKENSIPVTDVSTHTGFPEIMNGRVKTLHPFIYGGLLARRSDPSHMDAIKKLGITPIDMVIVNLYPFEETVAKEGVSFDEAIENIDIGGPCMLRAAAKNHEDVAVITDPADYVSIQTELEKNELSLSRETRKQLAKKVFEKTAHYDRAIYSYLAQ